MGYMLVNIPYMDPMGFGTKENITRMMCNYIMNYDRMIYIYIIKI